MEQVTREQVRQFRLHAHHLDRWYQITDVERLAGACGFQNSPPGAWETALFNRVRNCGQEDFRRLLEDGKRLLQAWSFRGAPVVFPACESDAFLSAIIPRGEEPWIYTQGIQLALDFLGLPFGELLALLKQVIGGLNEVVLQSKAALDQTLAEWMRPLLPEDKRALWNSPSMYGSPDTQTVGGAAVSFLLRPCAFLGLVVFGKREGVSPTFTSYQNWTGHPLTAGDSPEQKLARKYLHCYGPASKSGLADWLGCSPAQAERIWQTAAEELEAVSVEGKVRDLLKEDKALLLSPLRAERTVHLLGGHDPYLGLQDREIILSDKARQKQVWQTVRNPGAVLWEGRVAGMWKQRKKGKGLAIELSLWEGADHLKGELRDLCEQSASFQLQRLDQLTFVE